MANRPTIKDVAKAAGVSPATVSLVLSRSELAISKITREKVFKAAKELNYHPNQLAVSLATKRSNSIGLILPDVSNPFFSSLYKYIEKTAIKYNFTVVAGNTDDDFSITYSYLRHFADRQFDGVILAQSDFQGPEETEKLFNLIDAIDIPIVLIDRVYSNKNYPVVQVDHQQAGYLATKHLLEMGHRRIGCVTGPLGISGCKARLEGYKAALNEYGVCFDPSLIYEGKYDIQTGIQSVPFLLGKNVTAAFCFADYIAIGVYQEMRNIYKSIPEDLSVVSIDDTILAEAIQPPLTSVSQPVNEIAKTAVEALISQIHVNGKSEVVSILEPVLKVRASVKKYSLDVER